MKELYLFRHGQTYDNLNKRISGGDNDVELTDFGRNQARALGEIVKDIQFDIIYASDRKRAIETAELIFPGREIIKDPRLKEKLWGECDQITLKETEEKFPEVYAARKENIFKCKAPGGETLYEMAERLNPFLEELNKNQRNAIVSHSWTTKMILKYFFNISELDFMRIDCPNDAIFVIDFSKNTVDHIYKGRKSPGFPIVFK